MLHYNLHFRFQQILSVLVVPCRLQLLHHHRTSCQPPPETSGGRFLCGIREIHHCQFTFLVQARLEYLRFIVCIFVHALRVFKFLVISYELTRLSIRMEKTLLTRQLVKLSSSYRKFTKNQPVMQDIFL